MCDSESRNAIIEVDGRAGHWGEQWLLCDTTPPRCFPLASMSHCLLLASPLKLVISVCDTNIGLKFFLWKELIFLLLFLEISF